MSVQEVSERGKRSKTLERIMDSALEEFADHGYAGARTERIARRAGVNKAALYYHVGGKAVLYDTVLRGCFSTMLRSMELELERVSGPDERIGVFIRVLADEVLGSAHLRQIILGELSSGAGRRHQAVSECIGSIQDIYMDILSNGRGLGIFAKDSDPMPGFSMIFGGLLFQGAKAGEPAEGFTYLNRVHGPSAVDLADNMTRMLLSEIHL